MAKVKTKSIENTATAAQRTPLELINLYWERVWNNREVELIREICGDPIYRHDAESTTALSHDEQVTRVSQQSALEPLFTHEVLLADETHVCSVWNMVSRKDPSIKLSGIEIFRAENGRFTDCWNSTYAKGFWGRRGDPSVPHDLPPPRFLSSVDQIDHTWMQAMFAQAGVKVPRIAMARTEPIGHGNMSETVRVLLGYNADASEAPASVVCKFNAHDPLKMDSAAQYGSYRCEANTYELFGAEPPLRVPHLYHAKVSDDGRECNLVLEDLSSFCEPGDQLAGCGIDEAMAVVDELAKLHRRFWNAPELSNLGWIGSGTNISAQGAAIMHERFAGVLSDEEFAIMDNSLPLIAAWIAGSPEGKTLLHGDPRVDNILFDRRNPKAVRAYLIDWQITAIGEPQSDVAYFLSGSLSPEDRRACEHELVAAHAAAIAKVDPAYTPEAAFAAYRRNIVSGLNMTLVAACVIPSTPHTDKLLTTLARRNCAAIKDWR